MQQRVFQPVEGVLSTHVDPESLTSKSSKNIPFYEGEVVDMRIRIGTTGRVWHGLVIGLRKILLSENLSEKVRRFLKF
jgi:hypothetical protein